jgi:prepilin-type processing-associated H-X9-DG protein
VVLAIIGVLVGLILPALNNARESARRVQCSNNLMQIGLALHHYASDQNVLPPGVVNDTGPIATGPSGYHWSWIVQILTCLDQRELFRRIDFRGGVYDPINRTVRSVTMSVLHCPDDAGASVPASSTGIALSSYAGCHHDVEAPIDTTNHGVFFLNSRVRLEDVPDGLSHTVFVGEVTRAHPLGWFSGTRATLRNTGHQINRVDPSLLGIPKVAPILLGNDQDPEVIEDQIETGMIPVSPTFVGGFGSQHSRDGANFTFGDGSVRFLRAAMDLTVYRRLGHRFDGEPIDDEAY